MLTVYIDTYIIVFDVNIVYIDTYIIIFLFETNVRINFTENMD